MFCYSSSGEFRNQGPLPTEQRVSLIPVADEVGHTKHAEEKNRDVSVPGGRAESRLLGAREPPFQSLTDCPGSQAADAKRRRKRCSYLAIKSKRLTAAFSSAPGTLFNKCLQSLH